MSEYQKYCYARYLNVVGTYNTLLRDYDRGILYNTRSLKIIDELNDDYTYLRFHSISQIAGSYASLGNIELAEQYIDQMKQLQGINGSHIMYPLKGYIYFLQGRYSESLYYYNKSIECEIKDGVPHNSIYLTVNYLSKAEILNYLGRYQEAYAQIRQLHDMHKSIQKRSPVFNNIYTQMAKSELGLGKIDKAFKHINKAILSINKYNETEDLAISYVVQGDILLAQGNIKQAIESYKQVFTIYHYLYKEKSKNIAQVSELYNKGAKAACKSKDLYNYKFFGKPQIKEFGIHHPNTVDMFEYCKQYNMDIWVKNN